MRKIITTSLIFFIFCGIVLGERMGVGVMIGEPVGINFITGIDLPKYLNILAGWPGGLFYTHIDLNVKNNLELKDLFWYWGGGLFLKLKKEKVNKTETETKTSFGVRIPFGLEYITSINLAFLIEIAPALTIVPEMDFFAEGGLGIRYYFK